MIGKPEVLSARFETLPAPLGPGWVMRITATAKNIRRIAFSFVARVAQQRVDFLSVSSDGDLFEGYLRHTPQPGDRLFVGYLQANLATPVVYQPQISGTLVASQSEDDIGIIADDDRKRVTPTTGLPWRWICQIEPTEFLSNRVEEPGTGFLISNRHVLTAAHVVWKAFQNPQMHVISVRPAFDYDKEPFDSSTASRVRVCPRYTGEENQEEWDYGLITLHKPLGEKTIGQEHLGFWGSSEFAKKFAIGPVADKSFPHSMTAGYPGNKGGRQLWCAPGFLVNVGANLMRTTSDVTKGQSGSPVWVHVGDQQVAVGIAVAATRASNIVRRITQGVIDELRDWMKNDGEVPALSQPALQHPEQEITAPSTPFPGFQPAWQAVPQAPALAALPAVAGALTRSDGIDLYSGNTLPAWADLRNAGMAFIVHKASEGGGITDHPFGPRYRDTRANGFIRGSYHFYRHTDGQAGSAQGDQVVAAVNRLRPGDLAPALDFENSALAPHQHEPASAAEWRTELAEFLDTVETKLGRTPLIYTSASAWHHLSGQHDYVSANFAAFGEYPLWVKSYRPRIISVADNSQNPPVHVNVDLDTEPKPMTPLFKTAAGQAGEDRYNAQRLATNPLAANIPSPWRNTWALWQYSPYTPSSLQAHGFRDWRLDFDVTRGGIYFLRGLADLGRSAPHLAGNLNLVVWANPDRSLHLFEYVSNAWIEDTRLSSAPAPAAAGDPAAISIGDEQFVVYRAENEHIIVMTRSLSDTGERPWIVTDISNSAAVDDPSVMAIQNEIHVIYGDEANRHVHLRRTRGGWQTELFADPTGARPISGCAAGYIQGGALHIVSRAGMDGHLLDFSAQAGAPVDLSAGAHGVNVPAATYRPATYTQAGQASRIVYRAIHGHIWQIERDTLNALDLSVASGAPAAWGSPSCVVAGRVSIVYRGVDEVINEIFQDRGAWRTRQVAPDAAADPVAFLDQYGHAAVSFRALNGRVRLARCANNAWAIEDVG
jgi:GH25 family lysozyme M1 (1,4-beta-N-acetylmuramidase)/V8-like Glu-specific endopeptidase